MAPILSKVEPPSPRSPHEAAALAVRRARPVLDSFLEVLKRSIEGGHAAVSEAAEQLGRLSDRLVTGTMRLLEGYCCMDLSRFARGPEPKLQSSLPILFVAMLLMMLYNAFVFAYMPAAGIALNSRTSLIFHGFIFLMFSSFIQSVRTDPGSVPRGSEWRTYGVPPPNLKERKHDSKEPRWCRKSKAYKPDRAHFCRVLERPVLRMDHHCPWLGNTIGFANHKFFYLFLLYTSGACGFLGLGALELLLHATLPALTTFLLIGAEGLTALLSSVLVPFFFFHTWLLLRNMTTIEFCEMMRAKKESSGEDAKDEEAFKGWNYDLGCYKNLCSVLGENPLLWFLPVNGPLGDGTSFPSRGRKAVVEVEDPDDPEASHPVATPTGAAEEQDSLEDSATSAQRKLSQASDGELASFFVWHSAAEFVDDLRVGCEVVEESFENSLLCFLDFVTCQPPKVAATTEPGRSRHSRRVHANSAGSARSSSSSCSGADFLST